MPNIPPSFTQCIASLSPFRFSVIASFPPNGFTKIMLSWNCGMRPNNEFAIILKSGLMLPSIEPNITPSIPPKG